MFLHFVIPWNSDIQECARWSEQVDYFEKWKELVVCNLPLESTIGYFFKKTYEF